jgi:hypothetical protein
LEGTLRILIFLTLIASLVSCSKIRSFEEASQTKSEIDPLFEAKNINQKFNGDSVKVKLIVPLSKNTMGHYSIKDLLSPTCDKDDKNYEKCLVKLEKYYEKVNMPEEEKSFMQRFAEGAKFDLFNFFVKMGVSSKLRYSFDYPFHDIDPKFIKNANVSRIFFALEECDKEDIECQQRQEEKPLTFDFLDKFFLNISPISEEKSLEYLATEGGLSKLDKLDKEQFNRYADRAFGEQVRELKDTVDKDGNVSDDLFYNINIARFDNSKKNKKKRTKRSEANNIRANGKTFIYTLEENNIREAKAFFSSSLFDGVVKDVTLISTSLYVDLYGAPLKEKFFEIIDQNVTDLRNIGVIDFKGCTSESCTNLEVNRVDLLPLLKKSPHLRFDTYVSIKQLDYNDFIYSGYIEISVELDLPY